MRIAAIDIGSNTVLLLVAEIDDLGRIHVLEHQQQFPRLGRDVDKYRQIHPSRFFQISSILLDYKKIAERYSVHSIVAAGTSAIRDASNQVEFLKYITTATGIFVQVISGEKEAELSFHGAISGFPLLDRDAMVLDIGGGSTEISFADKSMIRKSSIQTGAVRLTERFFKHHPPNKEEISSARASLHQIFSKLTISGISSTILIGVAGTLTTLACLDLQLLDFDINKVSGYELSYDRVTGWCNRLLSMPAPDILSLSSAATGRADILPAGVLILEEFMKYYNFRNIIVSERGLRYGLLLREWEKELKAQNVR